MVSLLRLFFIAALFCLPFGAAAQYITIAGNISPGYACTGAAVSVPFNAYGTYNAGNVFTAQLSDQYGNFANATAIGSLSGTVSGTISATYPAALPTGGSYYIRVVSSNPVVVGNSNGNGIVHNPDTTHVWLTASPNPVCAGTLVLYSGSSNLGGSGTHAYWIRYSGQNYWSTIATGTVGGTSSLGLVPNPGDSIYYSVTVNAGCQPAHTVASPAIGVVVNPSTPASVSIAASANPVCAGTAVAFSATAVNGGTSPFYQWKVNGANAGANGPSFSYTPADGDAVTCVLTSSLLCPGPAPAVSNGIVMNVPPILLPAVSIAPTTPVTCTGLPVTYTATAVNGGASPQYQWKLNGANAGGNSSTYTFTPAAGDAVSCVLTSSALCLSQNSVTSGSQAVAVSPYLTPQVSIQLAHDTACSGAPAVFTALSLHGGAAPAYQWSLNGQPAGSGTDTFSAVLSANATVAVVLSSSAACLSAATATTLRAVPVAASVAPSVSISAAPGTTVGAGAAITFTAAPQHGGSAPAYQWRRNGLDLAGATGPTYTGASFSDNETVGLLLRSSELCALPDSAAASPLTIHVGTGLAEGPASDCGLRLSPNPASTLLRMEARWPAGCIGREARISLVNPLGEIVREEVLTVRSAVWEHRLVLDRDLREGLYLVRIAAGPLRLSRAVLIGSR